MAKEGYNASQLLAIGSGYMEKRVDHVVVVVNHVLMDVLAPS